LVSVRNSRNRSSIKAPLTRASALVDDDRWTPTCALAAAGTGALGKRGECVA
jgi:hypothetical protein